jgi:simple sugar transport system permease protein
VVNIAIEGLMLGAAFFGWLVSIYASAAGLPVPLALLAGVGAAVLTGGLLALLHAVLSITFKVDQIISGTVINILALGLTGFLNRALFFQQDVPHAPGVLPTLHIPLLADLPVVGRIFEQQPIALLAIAYVVLTHWVLFFTRWGLRTRAVGENPLAADTVGINVFRVRYANVVIGGLIAGLGGAYFTLESVPSFEPGQTAGRGFISLAAMIFGNWTPFGAWSATLLFGAAQALQINAQYFGVRVPSQLVGALPYLLTMLALTGIVGRTIPPAADGKAYEK